MKKNWKSITLCIISMILGALLQYGYHYQTDIQNERILPKMLKIIDSYFSTDKKLSLEDIEISALKEVIKNLHDPHTTYFDKIAYKKLKESISGAYTGMGFKALRYGTKNPQFVISRVFENSPSAKSELIEGDIIIKIDNQDVSNLTKEAFENIINETKEISFRMKIDKRL